MLASHVDVAGNPPLQNIHVFPYKHAPDVENINKSSEIWKLWNLEQTGVETCHGSKETLETHECSICFIRENKTVLNRKCCLSKVSMHSYKVSIRVSSSFHSFHRRFPSTFLHIVSPCSHEHVGLPACQLSPVGSLASEMSELSELLRIVRHKQCGFETLVIAPVQLVPPGGRYSKSLMRLMSR